ncbi:MAG TPA: bifunctional glutamate N-acetyltransferase/amino-acid acetyltransferase ArgJ [Burkholderiales bacterium]|nr:bifunctional glutamate N-acetyltransferase/amino-acid acetyltransferase ArgJ [Burkholderiales bacterium]
MAVNLPELPALHPVPGIRLGTTAAGIRKADRRDLVVIDCTAGSQAAAVFTQNRFCAAPVIVARAHLTRRMPRALLINTGFANAGTGKPGLADARASCQALAKQLGCRPDEVLPFSTGVIGERFPLDRLVAGMPAAVSRLSDAGWAEAAHGIMTTDTVAKGASRQVRIGKQTVTITGIAKGAGMIRPDMATMLAFIATDARIASGLLKKSLVAAADASFNRISVDGDSSTNDACALLASGKSAAIEPGSSGYRVFQEALVDVCCSLAQAIVRDGEGATKFITVDVVRGASEADCLEVAYTIAHSPLVKTAFFASDPNWGRILAAIGRAPVKKLDVDKVSIHLNDVRVVRRGALAPDYTEARGAAVMRETEITIRVDLAQGKAAGRVWTTDLSHDYVRINAEYRS